MTKKIKKEEKEEKNLASSNDEESQNLEPGKLVANILLDAAFTYRLLAAAL